MTETKSRKMLTPEERVAKLKAELAAAEAKAQAKNQKAIDALIERRDALVNQIAERNTKLTAINLELDSLGYVPAPADASELDEMAEPEVQTEDAEV